MNVSRHAPLAARDVVLLLTFGSGTVLVFFTWFFVGAFIALFPLAAVLGYAVRRLLRRSSEPFLAGAGRVAYKAMFVGMQFVEDLFLVAFLLLPVVGAGWILFESLKD